MECLLDSGQVQRAEDAGMKDPLATLALNPPAEQVSWSLGLPSPGREADTEAMGCILLPPVTFWKLTAHALRCQVLGTPLLGRSRKGR